MLEGAIKDVWGFNGIWFIDIELRKCISKPVLA